MAFSKDDFYDKPDYSKGNILATELPEDACLCNVTSTKSYKSLFLSISPVLRDKPILKQGMTVYFWRQSDGFYISFGKEPRLYEFFTSKLQCMTQSRGYTSHRATLPIRFVKKYSIDHRHCFTLIRKAEGVYYADISIQTRYTAYRPDSAETEDY